MKKSMYSLMLVDAIVAEVDQLAYQMDTNRSNLINQILAEYFSLQTPEMRIKEIFEMVCHHLKDCDEFKVQPVPSDFMFAIKSPLKYKYRPTIRYSIELYRMNQEKLGEFKVFFRTQHSELLVSLSEFFHLWTKLESKHSSVRGLSYTIEDGKFIRALMIPKESIELTAPLVSHSIGSYLKVFDECLKLYFSSEETKLLLIEQLYISYLKNGLIHL